MQEVMTTCCGSVLPPKNPPQNLVVYSDNHSHSFVGWGFWKVSAGQIVSALGGVGWVAGTGGSPLNMASLLLGMACRCPWPISFPVVFHHVGMKYHTT